MEDQLPFGYTRGQKRSYAQTEGNEGSASPAWYHDSHNNHTNAAHDPHLQLHPRSHLSCHHADPPPVNEGSSRLRFHLQHIGNPYSTSNTQPDRTAYDNSGVPDFPHNLPADDMPASVPRRFAGDGFDYRRPAGSARESGTPAVDLSGDDGDQTHIDLSQDEGVIDLTADDSGYGASQDGSNESAQVNGQAANRDHRPEGGRRRLPRGMDIIIDLDNGDEEWRIDTPPTVAPGSPEIEFISARTIDPPPRQPGNPDGDEVEFVRSNALPAAEVQRRRNEEMDRALSLIGDMHGRFTHLRTQVERFRVQVSRTAADLRGGPIAPPRGASRSRGHVHVGFAAPGLLDFQMVGFRLGNEEPDYQQAPPPPTYQAPPPAPEGFTRSPTEDGGPLICPNCEEELCVGEDEVKRQVWIVKACGHVYCGECTTNRATKRSAKGKERPPNTKPFKECVVDGCGKKVSSPRNMIQIFL